MKRFAMGILALTAFLPAAACANCGMIPFSLDVRLYEPNQNAFIGWNGEEEILVLSTDVHASKPTKVLEVLPVPSEPAVKRGDPKIFEKGTELINSRIRSQESQAPSLGGRLTAGASGAAPAGEVTFHERIGAHDIAVTHVLSAEGFCDWAEDYLRSAGADNPEVPFWLRMVVGEYIEDGYTWFVYDVLDLEQAAKTKDPIQYRFKSDAVYYPLKITQTDSERAYVKLMVLTPGLIKQFSDLPQERLKMWREPITLTQKELQDLDADMDALFDHATGLKLRVWNVVPPRRHFRHDLIAR